VRPSGTIAWSYNTEYISLITEILMCVI